VLIKTHLIKRRKDLRIVPTKALKTEDNRFIRLWKTQNPNQTFHYTRRITPKRVKS